MENRILRRLLRIWSTLVSGTLAAQGLGLVALGIAARALEVEMIGGIAVVQGVARLVDGTVNLRSGVALTRYGGQFLVEGERDAFVGLLKAGFLLDCATAVIATIITAGLLWSSAESLGVPEALRAVAPAYAVVVLVSVPGLHLAVLRLFDRYTLIAGAAVAGAALRVCFVAAAWAADAAPGWYLLSWLAGDVVVRILPTLFAVREIRKRGFGPLHRGRARAAVACLPGFWRMIWTTNASTTARALTQEADVVITGWLAGPAAAGVFRIAKSCASPLLQIGAPIQHAAFPELGRLWSRGERSEFLRHGIVSNAVGAGLGLAGLAGALVLADEIVRAIAGPGLPEAIPVFLILILAYAFLLTGMANPPMLSSMERTSDLLAAELVATAAFAAVAFSALSEYGAAGVATATLAHSLAWLVLTSLSVVFGMRALPGERR